MSKTTLNVLEIKDYPYPNELQYPDLPGREANQFKKNFIKYLAYCGDSNINNYYGFKVEKSASSHGVSIPQRQLHCICTHDIEVNCWIQHKRNPSLVLVVGSCCINKTMDSDNYKKRCIMCEELYRGRYRSCLYCRDYVIQVNYRLNPEYKVNFGKYKGKWIEKLLNDKNYCKWMLSTDPSDNNVFETIKTCLTKNPDQKKIHPKLCF